MNEETIGEWIDCVVDDDYQIWSEYPYPIKRKESERIIKETFDKSNGYVVCKLNGKKQYKHRIIAEQFIPNPDSLPCIDHINRNRADNRIENLRFVSYSENNKNKSSRYGIDYEYFDEIPCENEEDIIEVRDYGNHEFENLYFCDNYFYFWNGVQYKRLHINYRKNGSAHIWIKDIENNECVIFYSSFKKLYGID